jgi:TonB family protein
MKVKIHTTMLVMGMLLMAGGLFAETPATTDLKEPQAVRVVSPILPTEWARSGIQGEVKALFRLDDNGRPRDIRIESASRPELAASVKNALRSWRFEHSGDADVIYGLPFVFR